jgi:hypothetical protein
MLGLLFGQTIFMHDGRDGAGDIGITEYLV